jgi:cellulose synthase/poly-beta-1,6-N-acetylglucosamine synthase-like glycosyltransferase
MTLSVCTICQDEEEPIKWFLEACTHLTSNCPTLNEVVLIDGGSKDNTIDVIKSYMDKVPLKLLERSFDCTRDQQNFGLEHCTGDFVFTPDADMTWTSNFPQVFNSGFFNNMKFCDFPMIYTAKDAHHWFYKWSNGVNMRLHKRGPKWIRKFHVKLEGQTQGLPVCGQVTIFENSCRISSAAALLNRGQRRQWCEKDMIEEGIGPGPVDRFLGAAKHAEFTRLPDNLLNLVIPGT